jgi:hypothetical protein
VTIYSPQDLLLTMQDCFCLELQSVSIPPATCCIVSGQPVIAECCAGYAWVRMTGARPADAFPGATNRNHRCHSGVFAAELEFGVARCAAEPCDFTGPACCTEELDVAMLLQEDYAAMRRTLQCCARDELQGDEIVVGPWRVQGPQGGCIAGVMTATVRWMEGCSC